MAKSADYSASNIQVHNLVEGIRKRPSMYIGSVDDDGIVKLCQEIIDNGIDEYLAGRAKNIYITIKDNIIKIGDDGGGIPVEKHKKTNISALTTVLTMSHAGGKFDSDSYKTSGGTYGVGAKATVSLSSKFKILTIRNKKIYTQDFVEGNKKTEEPYVINKKLEIFKGVPYKRGTIAIFSPDPKIFKENEGKLTKEIMRKLLKWLKFSSYIHEKIKIHIDINGKKKIYYEPEGIKSYVNSLINDEEEKIGKMLVIKNEQIDMCLQWTGDSEENILYFTNGIYNIQGGDHKLAINEFISKAVEPYKTKRSEFRSDDLRKGCYGVVNIKISSPNFSSPTKEKLKDNRVKPLLTEKLKPLIEEFFNSNKKFAKDLTTRANDIRTIEVEEKKKIKALKDVKSSGNKANKLPEKYFEYTNQKAPVEDVELFIVEGDSAGGTAKKARFLEHQATLALKGKPKNVWSSDKPAVQLKCLSNAEVQKIISVLSRVKKGEKFAFGKIILLADPDPDGHHIALLVFGIILRYMPEYIKENKLFSIETPKYIGTDSKGNKYWHDDPNKIKEVLGQKCFISHIKGLGELNPDVLRVIAFEKGKRKLISVRDTLEENKAKELISLLKGGKEGRELRAELMDE